MSRSSEILSSINFTGDPNNIIQRDIIPTMDQRRGRRSPLTANEIISRLFSNNLIKPGEAVEFIDEARKSSLITPELAAEAADLWYYTHQPDCPSYARDPSPLLKTRGVDDNLATLFCVVKYTARLRFGNLPEYKEIEFAALAEYLQTRQQH